MESQLSLKNDFIGLLLEQTAEDEGLISEEYISRHIRQYEDQTGEEFQNLFVAGELDNEELEELLLTSHLATHEVNEVAEQYYYELRKGMTIEVISVIPLVVGIISGVIAVACAYNDAYGAGLTCGAIGVILVCARLGMIIWASADQLSSTWCLGCMRGSTAKCCVCTRWSVNGLAADSESSGEGVRQHHVLRITREFCR